MIKTIEKTDRRAATFLRQVDAALGSDAIGGKDVEIREGVDGRLWAIDRADGGAFHYFLNDDGTVSRMEIRGGDVVEHVHWRAGLRSKAYQPSW